MDSRSKEPDIFILDEDWGFTVEISILTGPTTRRVVEFEANDRAEAEELAQSLLTLSQRPCEGDAIDALLGVGLLEE